MSQPDTFAEIDTWPDEWTGAGPDQPKLVDLCSEVAYQLVATRPPTEAEAAKGITLVKCYVRVGASERERLALLKPGRRTCSW